MTEKKKTIRVGKMVSDEVARDVEEATLRSAGYYIRVGARLQDGTIYAGTSPDTGAALYALPQDAGVTMDFNAAAEYARRLNAENARGHSDWHVPTKEELNVLFNNRAAIGGFNETGANPAGYYWSSTQPDEYVICVQRFSDGQQGRYAGYNESSVRCVRSGAR